MRARLAAAAGAAGAAALALLLGACASAPPSPLEGRIWDARALTFVSEDALVARLAAARYRLLGEVHDHPRHHQLRARLIGRLAGDRPRIFFEQFDRENDDALREARRAGADADGLARAGKMDAGWRWPLHRPLLQAALDAGLEIRAANLSRSEARRIASGGVVPGAPELEAPLARAGWTASDEAQLRGEIVEAHCGVLPESAATPMALSQRARDAAMALALGGATGPAILIAGNGHVRRDRGVPRYLPSPREALSVGFVEAAGDAADPRAAAGPAENPFYDYVWFTAPQSRPDPCEEFRKRKTSAAAGSAVRPSA